MNPLFFDACWLVGGILSAAVLHKGFHAGWWSVHLKREPRIDQELSDELRPRSVDAAFRTHGQKILRADFNRNFK